VLPPAVVVVVAAAASAAAAAAAAAAAVGTVIGRKEGLWCIAVNGAQAASPAEKRLQIHIRLLHHEDVLFREHMGRTKAGRREQGNQSVGPSLGWELEWCHL
jgi:hypothetical protein